MAGKARQKLAAQKFQAQAKETLLQSQAKIAEAIAEQDSEKRAKLLADAGHLADSAKSLSSFAAKLVV